MTGLSESMPEQDKPVLRVELQAIIFKGYSEGHQRYGDLGLSVGAYSDRLLFIVRKHVKADAPPADATAFADKLHGQDLYLATACAQHNLGRGEESAPAQAYTALAWKTLEENYRGFVCDLARFFDRSNVAIQDLADNVFADLYLPDRSGSSRIASYDGRSSLSTWLRVVICNRVINMQRSTVYSKTTDIPPDVPDDPAMQAIESVLRARRYQNALRNSLESACRLLTSRERLLILWRYEDGLQLGQIASLLGIHQSNVTRQLIRLQAKLRSEVISTLATAHGLSEEAIQECCEDIVENPRHEISVLDFIRDPANSSESRKKAKSHITAAPSSREKQG